MHAPIPEPVWYLEHAEHGNKPWAVQTEALRRSFGHRGYAYFLEQGLGKTSLALNDFIDHYCGHAVDGCLVIAPNSYKMDWALAVKEWGLHNLKADYWPACELPDRLQDQLLAINYEAVSRPGKVRDYILWLMDQSRVFLVVDESMAVSKLNNTTRAVVELAKRSAIVRILNGTPYANDVRDYWGQLRTIGAISGVSPTVFRNRYAKMGGYMGKQCKGILNEDELVGILDRCSFRALKKDWRADLPPKVYSTLHVEMTKRQRHHYLEMMEEFYTQIQEMELEAAMVLVQMEKLRQISSGMAMRDGLVEWLEQPKDLPKLQALTDWLTTSPTKAIVSCIYRESINLVAKTCGDLGLMPAVIRGGMTPEEWSHQKRRFNETRDCRVLVGQQSAIFRGHTLIGMEGDRCARHFFYESNFSRYERAQLEDRIHRGAQDETCSYVDVVSSPIDQKTLNVLLGKKQMADFMDELVMLMQNREW